MACCIDDIIMMINAQQLRARVVLVFVSIYVIGSTLVPVMDADDINYHHHPVHLALMIT
jgi:hypothetical protein